MHTVADSLSRISKSRSLYPSSLTILQSLKQKRIIQPHRSDRMIALLFTITKMVQSVPILLLVACQVTCLPMFGSSKDKSYKDKKAVSIYEPVDLPMSSYRQSSPTKAINENLRAPPTSKHSSPTYSDAGFFKKDVFGSSGKALARAEAKGKSFKVDSDEEQVRSGSESDDNYYSFAEAVSRPKLAGLSPPLYNNLWSQDAYSSRQPTAGQIAEAVSNALPRQASPRLNPQVSTQRRFRLKNLLSCFNRSSGLAPLMPP